MKWENFELVCLSKSALEESGYRGSVDSASPTLA